MSNKQVIPAEEIIELTKAALEDVKAQDVQVINLKDKNSITDYMVIATGTSNRQIGAMREKVREMVKAKGVKPLGEEGAGDSDWVLLDLDTVVVHMMTAASRQFYDLERLWLGAEQSRAASAAHHTPGNEASGHNE